MKTNSANLWNIFINRLNFCLSSIEVTDAKGLPVPLEAGIKHWHDLAAGIREKGGCLYLIGNGASASMSSHFAADLNKNASIRTQVFTDPALLTAIANDISFESIFAEPIFRMAKTGDMLVSISSSGDSPNILAAISVAKQKGLCVVTLSGFNGNNRSRKMGELNIYVPEQTYSMVETAHAALLHHWTDLLVASDQNVIV